MASPLNLLSHLLLYLFSPVQDFFFFFFPSDEILTDAGLSEVLTDSDLNIVYVLLDKTLWVLF